MKNQEQAVRNTLTAYANTLNSADAASIPGFYTHDGKFMPEGFKTISKIEGLKKKADDYLSNSDFKIDYSNLQIVIENQLAFVTADAKTSQKDHITGAFTGKLSRDFFVLKMVADSWKIYRYIFNNVGVI